MAQGTVAYLNGSATAPVEVSTTTPLPVSTSVNVTTTTVTIANGASLSGASSALSGKSLAALITPSGWGTAAVAFQVSVDNVNWFVLCDSTGTEVSLASVAASSHCALDPTLFLGAVYVKVQSGTSGAPTNQAGGDIVTLVLV